MFNRHHKVLETALDLGVRTVLTHILDDLKEAASFMWLRTGKGSTTGPGCGQNGLDMTLGLCHQANPRVMEISVVGKGRMEFTAN